MIDVAPHKLIYLSLAGSHLFGTNTPRSDMDVKGLFLPSRESLILQDAPQHFSRHTNNPGSGLKNTATDVDVGVWSVQFWLRLLEKGDINAVSLLFSHTNLNAVLDGTDAEFLDHLRSLEPTRLLSRNLSGMMGFAYSQAVKYTDKGRHLRAVRVAIMHLGRAKNGLVGDVSDTILTEIADDTMIRMQFSSTGQKQLVILEKSFDYTARASWALEPLRSLEAGYGKRAQQAMQSGVDFKAFSHSLRVLEEIRQLHLTGRITYPHTQEFAAVMRDAKLGLYGYDRLVNMLDDKLEAARAVEAQTILPERTDRDYARDFLLSLY